MEPNYLTEGLNRHFPILPLKILLCTGILIVGEFNHALVPEISYFRHSKTNHQV